MTPAAPVVARELVRYLEEGDYFAPFASSCRRVGARSFVCRTRDHQSSGSVLTARWHVVVGVRRGAIVSLELVSALVPPVSVVRS